MKILGLDPGSRHTGYGLIETEAGNMSTIAHGRFSCPAKQPLPNRLAELTHQLLDLVQRWHPDIAVLETPFLGMNARSLVVLAQARGALLSVLAGQGLEIDEYTPAEIKSAVAGNGRAEKDQVARMVRLHLSLNDEKLTEDAADALAVAICFAQRYRMDRILKGQR